MMLLIAAPLVFWGIVRPVPMDSDAEHYARVARQLVGEPQPSAVASAAWARCDSYARTGKAEVMVTAMAHYRDVHPEAETFTANSMPEPRVHLSGASPEWLAECAGYLTLRYQRTDPRYSAIFDSRPGFPAVAAPLIGTLGDDLALRLVATLSTAVAAVLWAVIGRLAGLSWPLALGVQAVVSLTPFSHWGTRPFAEGFVAAACALLIAGVSLAGSGRKRSGIIAQLTGAVLLVFAKAYIALILGAVMLFALVVAAALRRTRPRASLLPGPALALLGGLVVPQVAGWPGLMVTLQDLATRHFLHRDVKHPVQAYRRILLDYLGAALTRPALILAVGAVVVLLVVVLVRWRRGEVWAAVLGPIGIGVGSVIAHPVALIDARLFSAAWPGIVLAGALAAHLVTSRVRKSVAGRRTS